MPVKQKLYGYKARYIVVWLIIAGAIIASIVLIVYNSNAVMTIFGKGTINLNSFDDMLEVVTRSPDTYSVIALSGEDFEIDYVEYEINGGALSFRIEGEENEITGVFGEIDLTGLEISRPMRLYSTLNSTIRPLCAQKDVLAAEIAILQFVRNINFFDLSENFIYESEYDDFDITIERIQYSTNLSFSIITA